ncbi:hypothetical protein NMT12_40106 [metagenome]
MVYRLYTMDSIKSRTIPEESIKVFKTFILLVIGIYAGGSIISILTPNYAASQNILVTVAVLVGVSWIAYTKILKKIAKNKQKL